MDGNLTDFTGPIPTIVNGLMIMINKKRINIEDHITLNIDEHQSSDQQLDYDLL